MEQGSRCGCATLGFVVREYGSEAYEMSYNGITGRQQPCEGCPDTYWGTLFWEHPVLGSTNMQYCDRQLDVVCFMQVGDFLYIRAAVLDPSVDSDEDDDSGSDDSEEDKEVGEEQEEEAGAGAKKKKKGTVAQRKQPARASSRKGVKPGGTMSRSASEEEEEEEEEEEDNGDEDQEEKEESKATGKQKAQHRRKTHKVRRPHGCTAFDTRRNTEQICALNSRVTVLSF